jgi:hypothetical protein
VLAWVSGIGGQRGEAGPVEDIRGIGVEVRCRQWLALVVTPGTQALTPQVSSGDKVKKLESSEMARASARY